MLKRNRNYKLVVSTSEHDTITIGPPFTLEFDVQRNILGAANGSKITITNLSQKNRDRIRKNSWDPSDNRPVTLLAGYGENLSKIFQGTISEAWSVRPAEDFLTQIESFDAGFAYATADVSVSFPAGVPFTSVITNLISLIPNVSLGAIGSYPGTLSRGNTYNGNPITILSELTGQGFFIDNGKAYALGDLEVIRGSLPVISSENGLIGTPIREKAFIDIDIMFEPRLVLGQLLTLNSSTGPVETRGKTSAVCKVVGISHRGMISPVQCGTAITSVQLSVLPSTAAPRVVQ